MVENAFDFLNTIEAAIGAFLILEFDDWVLELLKEFLISDDLIQIVKDKTKFPEEAKVNSVLDYIQYPGSMTLLDLTNKILFSKHKKYIMLKTYC